MQRAICRVLTLILLATLPEHLQSCHLLLMNWKIKQTVLTTAYPWLHLPPASYSNHRFAQNKFQCRKMKHCFPALADLIYPLNMLHKNLITPAVKSSPAFLITYIPVPQQLYLSMNLTSNSEGTWMNYSSLPWVCRFSVIPVLTVHNRKECSPSLSLFCRFEYLFILLCQQNHQQHLLSVWVQSPPDCWMIQPLSK